ncbi:MAG: phosphatidate cytidylyltransferase [Hyphomicrobiales bacterium]
MRGAERSLLTRLREHELASRVASALGLAALALGATALGGVLFALLWAGAAVFFFAEFLTMIAYRPRATGASIGAVGIAASALGVERGALLAGLAAICLAALLVAARAETSATRSFGAAGLLYAACVALPVIVLRSVPMHGFALTVWLYAVVWATDIGAFFIGRRLGGPKLWPRISPRKTWSGLIGGTLTGVGAAWLVNSWLVAVPLSGSAFLAVSVVASLAAHAGDLLESALKRKYSVKDSSQLIPGHGGFMDRLDGFALAALAAATGFWIAR